MAKSVPHFTKISPAILDHWMHVIAHAQGIMGSCVLIVPPHEFKQPSSLYYQLYVMRKQYCGLRTSCIMHTPNFMKIRSSVPKLKYGRQPSSYDQYDLFGWKTRYVAVNGHKKKVLRSRYNVKDTLNMLWLFLRHGPLKYIWMVQTRSLQLFNIRATYDFTLHVAGQRTQNKLLINADMKERAAVILWNVIFLLS